MLSWRLRPCGQHAACLHGLHMVLLYSCVLGLILWHHAGNHCVTAVPASYHCCRHRLCTNTCSFPCMDPLLVVELLEGVCIAPALLAGLSSSAGLSVR